MRAATSTALAVALWSLFAPANGQALLWRRETYDAEDGFLMIWWVFTIILAIGIVAYVALVSASMHRWHLLLAADLFACCLFYILRFSVYIGLFKASDYSATVFLDSMLSIFQLSVLSDANFLWLFEYTRYSMLTLVRRNSICPDLVIKPGFSQLVNFVIRACMGTLMLFSAIIYAGAYTKNQDTIGRVLVVFWAFGFFAYAPYILVASFFLLSSYSYTKKKRRGARRALRANSLAFVYLPAFWAAYHLAFVIWAAVARSNVGDSGVLYVVNDANEAIKTPLMVLSILIALMLRVRDHQEHRDLVLFSSDDEVAAPGAVAPPAAVAARPRFQASITKDERSVFPVEDHSLSDVTTVTTCASSLSGS